MEFINPYDIIHMKSFATRGLMTQNSFEILWNEPYFIRILEENKHGLYLMFLQIIFLHFSWLLSKLMTILKHSCISNSMYIRLDVEAALIHYLKENRNPQGDTS